MRSHPTALLALLLLTGCGGDDEIRLYWVPKQAHDHAGHDHAGHDHAGHDHGAAASAAPAGEEATWSMPAGWELDPTPRAMRYATLLAGPLEVAVTQFPGRVGTVVQNVERWRRQLGLPPAPPHELEQGVTPLEHPEAEAAQVDLRHAEDDVRMWVAQLHRPEVTWYVKTQGSVAEVEAALPALQAFVSSMRFAAGAPAPSTPPRAGAAAGLPAWETPAGWQPTPAQPPRLAGFAVGAGEATVTAFPGQVGDLLSNINRWRGQLGLAPVGGPAELETAPVEVQLGDAAGMRVELAGPEQGMRVVLAAHGGQTWFFKLTAPVAELAAQQGAFDAWVASVDFHAGGGHGHGQASPDPAPAGPGPTPAAPFDYTAPTGWTPGAANPPRLLTLHTANGAELSVTRFGGAVGTLDANVTRWRRQLGSTDTAAVRPEAVTISGIAGELVELVGPEGAIRVASVPQGGQTWFFKLMGSAEAVAADRDGLAAFLASVELR